MQEKLDLIELTFCGIEKPLRTKHHPTEGWGCPWCGEVDTFSYLDGRYTYACGYCESGGSDSCIFTPERQLVNAAMCKKAE